MYESTEDDPVVSVDEIGFKGRSEVTKQQMLQDERVKKMIEEKQGIFDDHEGNPFNYFHGDVVSTDDRRTSFFEEELRRAVKTLD